MTMNVGVNVSEVDGPAAPTIAGAATSVAAFLGVTERGVPDRPVVISNSQQYLDRFGQHRADGFVAYALEGFFLNGGQRAYVSRVAGAGSIAASARLSNRQTPAGPALTVSAGYRGAPDPGRWGERLRIDVRDDPWSTTSLQADIGPNATTASLVSVGGLGIGSVVLLADGANRFYRKLIGVDPVARTVRWSPTEPIGPNLAAASATVTTAEFSITVQYQAGPGASLAAVEQWRHQSLEPDSADYVVDRVNSAVAGSRYITVADTSAGAPSGVRNPAIVSNVVLGSSAENAPVGSDYTGSPAASTGLHAFDTAQVQLVAIPDVHNLAPADRDTVVRAALDYCAGRGDCMYVGSAPNRGAPVGAVTRVITDYTQLESDYVDAIEAYSAPLQAAKVYGALYAPWIQVGDPLAAGPAATRFIPADGHVMGVYARTDQERGIWKAPAGDSALVRGALAAAARFTDAQHTSLVRSGFVNAIRPQRGVGIVVAASRTLSTDTRWWYVNVRLLFNFVKSSLRTGLRFVRQEPNSDALRRSVRLNVVTPFLLSLWRLHAFGSDPPAMVFSVKCDDENNPPSEVNLGNFRIDVLFYPVRPAETVLIIVGQQPAGSSATEG